MSYPKIGDIVYQIHLHFPCWYKSHDPKSILLCIYCCWNLLYVCSLMLKVDLVLILTSHSIRTSKISLINIDIVELCFTVSVLENIFTPYFQSLYLSLPMVNVNDSIIFSCLLYPSWFWCNTTYDYHQNITTLTSLLFIGMALLDTNRRFSEKCVESKVVLENIFHTFHSLLITTFVDDSCLLVVFVFVGK